MRELLETISRYCDELNDDMNLYNNYIVDLFNDIVKLYNETDTVCNFDTSVSFGLGNTNINTLKRGIDLSAELLTSPSFNRVSDRDKTNILNANKSAIAYINYEYFKTPVYVKMDITDESEEKFIKFIDRIDTMMNGKLEQFRVGGRNFVFNITLDGFLSLIDMLNTYYMDIANEIISKNMI